MRSNEFYEEEEEKRTWSSQDRRFVPNRACSNAFAGNSVRATSAVQAFRFAQVAVPMRVSPPRGKSKSRRKVK